MALVMTGLVPYQTLNVPHPVDVAVRAFPPSLQWIGFLVDIGATAGLAGAVQVMGVQYRLIEGYSTGFGFVSVAIALLGGLDPLLLIPASLFFGFLETGMAAMQRQVGVPAALVGVIEGLVMLTVLAGTASGARDARV